MTLIFPCETSQGRDKTICTFELQNYLKSDKICYL